MTNLKPYIKEIGRLMEELASARRRQERSNKKIRECYHLIYSLVAEVADEDLSNLSPSLREGLYRFNPGMFSGGDHDE
jgi:hypothetical protein